MMGIVLAEERTLAPAMIVPAPARFTHAPPLRAAPAPPMPAVRRLYSRMVAAASMPEAALPAIRRYASNRLALPALIVASSIAVAAMVPALGALASGLTSSQAGAAVYGPPVQLRAGAGVGSNWEDSVRMSQPAAGDLGAAFIAGRAEQQYQDLVHALSTLNQQRIDGENAAAAGVAPPATPHTLGAASNYGPGTVIAGARITIYGCVGPGGGFCGGMAGGGAVFEGAAACSYNLAFGTRFTIDGDPTGRVYECLDRGALPSTWIDVFFYNTEDGFAWASQLGSTRAAITIVN